MDREVKLNFKDRKFAKYIKIVLIAVLVIIEIIICAQHVGKRNIVVSGVNIVVNQIHVVHTANHLQFFGKNKIVFRRFVSVHAVLSGAYPVLPYF